MDIVHSWLNATRVCVSKGATHPAEVTKSRDTTVGGWLNWQTGHKREGKMTAAEYAAAAASARNSEKSSFGWYSFARYEGGHRNAGNWTGSSVVVLDADAKYGTESGPQFAFTAPQLRARLAGLDFVALPSYSFEEACPRWRIVVPLSEIVTDRAEYGAIARHLGERLCGYVDPRSYTPEQLWFSLSAPRGEWEKRLDQIVVGG